MLKTLIAIFALVPAVGFAKTTHKTVTTTTTTTNADGTVTKKTTTAAAPAATADNDQANGTLFGGSGNGSSIASSLRGLSLFAMYDFADQIEDSAGKADTERAFDIGASYETSQFTPGVAAQFGAQYDFSRATKNTDLQLKYSEILGFAELTAHLTTAFKLMGGLNYNFPSADNLPQGMTLKGNVGYQLGGSFAFNQHIAIDARYRSVQYTLSGNNRSIDEKQNGFTMGARYMF